MMSSSLVRVRPGWVLAILLLATAGPAWADEVLAFRSPDDVVANNLLAPIDLVADGSLYGDFNFW